MTGKDKLADYIIFEGYMDMLCPASYGLTSSKECLKDQQSDCNECWKKALESECED